MVLTSGEFSCGTYFTAAPSSRRIAPGCLRPHRPHRPKATESRGFHGRYHAASFAEIASSGPFAGHLGRIGKLFGMPQTTALFLGGGKKAGRGHLPPLTNA